MEQIMKQCPHCGQPLDIPDEYWGRKAECPYCLCKFIIGTGEVLAPPQPVPSAPRDPDTPSLEAGRVGDGGRTPPQSGKRTGHHLLSRALILSLGILLVAAGIGYGVWHHAPSSRKRDAGGESRQPSPPFKVIATISGVDVVVRNSPFTLPSADPQLDILFSRGATPFKAELERRLRKILTSQTDDERLKTQIASPLELMDLSRYELVRISGTHSLDQVCKRPEGKAFLTEFLTSQSWLDDFLTCTPLPDGGGSLALHGLCSIYRYDKSCTLPLYRKLASAFSHTVRGQWESDAYHYKILNCYQAQRRAHQEGRMHGSFDRMESWEMAYVVLGPGIGGDREVEYYLNQVNYPRPNYYKACWKVYYIMRNMFGDSILGRDYYRPWFNDYFGWPLRQKVGGVCGTLSTYGSFLSRAHGVPSFPVGQPGHCAYMVRGDDETWGTAYSVTGHTNAGCLFGRGDESIVRLMQAAYTNRNRPRVLRSLHHDWQARALQTLTGETLSPAEKRARKLSLKAVPLNLNHWRDYVDRLRQDPRTPRNEWKNLAREAIAALGRWQRPCWEFLDRKILSHVEMLSPPDYRETVTEWHKVMPCEGTLHRFGAGLKGHLQMQACRMKSPGEQALFFGDLLDIYSNTPDFITVVEWGQEAFSRRTSTAPLFLEALDRYRRLHPGKMSDIAAVIGRSISEAEAKGDLKMFRMASGLAEKIYPGRGLSIAGLDKKVLEKVPGSRMNHKGKLLSSNAVPRLSDLPGDLYPFAHAAALREDGVGLLISRKTENPSLTLKLQGRCRIGALVMIGRFEKKGLWGEGIPLVVEISLDGKKWKRIGSVKKVLPLYEYDLSANPLVAQYIRFTCHDPKGPRTLAFRAVRIYGEPLY